MGDANLKAELKLQGRRENIGADVKYLHLGNEGYFRYWYQLKFLNSKKCEVHAMWHNFSMLNLNLLTITFLYAANAIKSCQ